MKNNDPLYLVSKIRTRYTPKEHGDLEELKALDAKVKRPANVFAYVFGGISALVMGSGMSFVMTELGGMLGIAEPMIPGIVIGVAGMLMAIVNYPIYQGILGSRRKKYADKIIALSDRITKE